MRGFEGFQKSKRQLISQYPPSSKKYLHYCIKQGETKRAPGAVRIILQDRFLKLPNVQLFTRISFLDKEKR
jgi:hypothetical protein